MTTSFLPDDATDVQESTLSAALAEFADVVGQEWVLTSKEALAEFRDPFQPVGWDNFSAAAVVQPETTEQVQEIVRIAARYGIPLWTQSQGRNNGYGGAAPRLSGAVTINLRRMNKILEINEELSYALVEPGVSFLQLYQEIQARGLPLLLSVPDIGWGSVTGNALEHGVTYLPNGNDFAAPCGMEVVLADGELLRTGLGAQPGNESWNLYRRSYGPMLDDLFKQSNFGIVTKLGVWLSPAYETIMHVHIDAYRDDDLAPLVDILRKLRLDGTVDGVPCLLNTMFVASITGPRTQWYDGDPSLPIPDDAIDEIAKRLDMGRWHLRLALYGDEPVVDYNFGKIKAAFEQIRGVRVVGAKTTSDQWADLPNPSDLVLSGVPNQAMAEAAPWYGGGRGLAGHMTFSPVVPLVGEKMLELHKFLRAQVESVGMDYAVDAMIVNARSSVYATGMIYDYEDEKATARAYQTIQELVREAGKRGYTEYRAHLHFMDLAAEQLSFNDHVYRRFLEKIKDAVDPVGILSPGKQGIWPKAFRKDRTAT